jgi:hypothetical protein
MTRRSRLPRPPRLPRHPRPRRARGALPLAGIICAGLVVIGAWLLTWWIVPLAALVTTVLWWDGPKIVPEVTWGAVAGWVVLLLIDSLHGRTWALARAAGGAVFLPWGLLIPVTLLFAAGLAWSTAVLAQFVCAGISARVSATPRQQLP